VLHHVDGQQLMIERSQRRRNRDPYNAHAAEKNRGPEGEEPAGRAQIHRRDPGERDPSEP
jgi:hypothetical protein